MSFADELADEFTGRGTTECPACENDGKPCNLCKPGSIPVGFTDEDRIRAIVREEIVAYFRQSGAITSGDGGTIHNPAAFARAVAHLFEPSYGEYLYTRDEPPTVPPVPNTTEPL